jgi:hypothetical protein
LSKTSNGETLGMVPVAVPATLMQRSTPPLVAQIERSQGTAETAAPRGDVRCSCPLERLRDGHLKLDVQASKKA